MERIFYSSSLSGTGKDKSRCKLFVSKTRVRKENLAEDAEAGKLEESLLADCKSYLGSIFLHWEVDFPLSEPQLAQQRDGADLSPLTRDTAHLLVKWSLRCLAEESYDGERTKRFLDWMAQAVVKRRQIVDLLLVDDGLKADLLRLHHRAFEADRHSSTVARMETLQIFTSIMLCLLEARGDLPELHRAVVSACPPELGHDQATCGEKPSPLV